jgi:hypothetical protein
VKTLLFVLCILVFAAAPVLAAGERVPVTSEVLTIEDVTPMLQDFVNSKPDQQLLEVFGISQAPNSNLAKVFFKYMKAGRGGSKPDEGELNCYKLNSGKWYCGGIYDIMKK